MAYIFRPNDDGIVKSTMGPYASNKKDAVGFVDRFLEPMMHYAESDTSNDPKSTYTEEHRYRDITGAGKDEFTEYDNIKFLYGQESEHATINAYKQRAIQASHAYALNPTDKTTRRNFNLSQYDLREIRGRYIANHAKSLGSRQLFGYDLQTAESKNKYTLVEFTCTENKEAAIPVPILSKVNGIPDIFKTVDNAIFDMTGTKKQIKDYVSMKQINGLVDQSMGTILGRFNCPKINKKDLEKMQKTVSGDIDKDALTSDQDRAYFSLGADAEHWDDTNRHKFATSGWKKVNFMSDESKSTEITYRCDINHITPVKTKMEQNAKTAHRFSLDFSRILKAMFIDLVIRMGNFEFVWTIHEFEKHKHQIYHAGYTSKKARLFEMPGTLEEMTRSFTSGVDKYNNAFFNKATVESARIDRRDDISMMNLHIHALEKKIKEIDVNLRYPDVKVYHTDAGYIYKYNMYTIVASCTRYSEEDSDDKENYINFYTIIHWNNTPFIPETKPSQVQVSTASDERLKHAVVGLEKYAHSINEQIGMLVRNRISVPTAALSKTNFFIPAILKKKTGSGERVKSENEIGVFLFMESTQEVRDIIETESYRKMIAILLHEIPLPKNDRGRIEPKRGMIEHLKEQGKNDKSRFGSLADVLGYFLEVDHVEDIKHSDRGHDTKTVLEEWSDSWHDYFSVRPQFTQGDYMFAPRNSKGMDIIKAKQYDDIQKARSHLRETDKHKRVHEAQFPPLKFLPGRGGQLPKNGNRRVKPRPNHDTFFNQSQYSQRPSQARLAAAVDCQEFTPQPKLQAEIDSLKRTLNELVLKAGLH